MSQPQATENWWAVPIYVMRHGTSGETALCPVSLARLSATMNWLGKTDKKTGWTFFAEGRRNEAHGGAAGSLSV